MADEMGREPRSAAKPAPKQESGLSARALAEMSDQEFDNWLKIHKISGLAAARAGQIRRRGRAEESASILDEPPQGGDLPDPKSPP